MEYDLSDQPVFGEWSIRVLAQGQVEEFTFVVEEYYQTRFEVRFFLKYEIAYAEFLPFFILFPVFWGF